MISSRSVKTRRSLLRLLAGCSLAAVISLPPACNQQQGDSGRTNSPEAKEIALPYRIMAASIVTSLQPDAGERVLLRFDPGILPALLPEVRAQLEEAGTDVEILPYGPVSDFEQRLRATDIYIWLPNKPNAKRPEGEAETLARWLDAGRGRQIHFHWGGGTVGTDGLPGTHSAAFDQVYLDALDIDYEELNRRMEAAIAKVRSGEVHVTTPAGTDIRFRVGERPFSKQNGDGSKARMARARLRIDREIELPAGALRVAPLEDSVEGTVVIPRARIGETEATGIRLAFERGTVTRATAEKGQAALDHYLDANPSLTKFREFALGMNHKLTAPERESWIAYYGYGAGVVRLSLGNNTELGGRVRGRAVRWFFFPVATVRVGDDVLVDAGELVLDRW